RHGRKTITGARRALRWREIAAPAKPQVLDTPARNARPHVPIAVKKRKWTPPANHPSILRPAARRRSEPPSWRPQYRARCWPSPPLRPNRFALRAPQGCAPDQANKNRGCRRSRVTGIVVPRASWRENFSIKAKSSYGKEKEPRTRTQKRGHF